MMSQDSNQDEEKYVNILTDAEIAKFTPQERRAYETSLKYYRDIKNVVDTSLQEGLKKGREEGIKEGREEGIKEGLKRAARNMKLAGFANSEIAESTGLSENEIEQL